MWWAALVTLAWGAEAESCRPCHLREFEQNRNHAHSTALRRAGEHQLAARFESGQPVRSGPYLFTANAATARTWDRDNAIELPLEWAFGSGKQAVTFVTRVDSEWYVEHALSYYPAINGFALTPGHADRQPRDLKEAAGVLYRIRDPQHGIAGCFECHASGVRFNAQGIVELDEPGVRCQACHPGHRTPHGKGKPLKRTASQINEECGRCHRPPASDASKIDWNYAWNVRHQPIYLSQSACFVKGKLSCLGCHSPHAPLETASSFYNAKCAACHAKPAARCETNCVDCHMPRVSPQPSLRFANHWIGVYGEGSRLKPKGR